MSLTAAERDTIRYSRDRHLRDRETRDTRGRRNAGTGPRGLSLAQLCFEQADGDPVLALCFAADLIDRYGDIRGLAARHRDKQ
jgi:hypothetical protein